jgi:hypothetical protein
MLMAAMLDGGHVGWQPCWIHPAFKKIRVKSENTSKRSPATHEYASSTK